jgi:hypothetical protein
VPVQVKENGYFEAVFNGPFKGANLEQPENQMAEVYSPSLQNFILKNSELRTRPRISVGILGTPDKFPLNVIDTFMDGNNVAHTVMVTRRGLFQLSPVFKRNLKKAWNIVGTFPVQPGPDIPVANEVFLNKFYWTNGSNNLWAWDGISSVGTPVPWVAKQRVFQNFRIIDSNGNVQIVIKPGFTGTAHPVWSMTIGQNTVDTAASQPATWVNNGKPAPSNGFYGTAVIDATNGITSGAFYLGILASRMLMLSTIEGSGQTGQAFTQRVRWCPSGLPSIWDPNVNIGAGFNDFLEVPDAITGFMAIGDKTGFVFRNNGITVMTAINNGILPFDFNHLWASDNGIGNVFPFSISAYGPIGMFISDDDIYNISIGGFKNVGGPARDGIFADLGHATSTPLSTIIPKFANGYAYLMYLLAIPFGNDTKFWGYSIEDNSWIPWIKKNVTVTGRANFVATA